MNPWERLIVLLLRFGGCFLLLAFPALFLPEPWMASTHRWLGLGEFPASPLVDYLTRSVSGLYAMHGGLLLVLSRDVRRFAPLIVYTGAANLAFGTALLLIGLHAGLPRFWVVAEGPWVIGTGLLLLGLMRKLDG